MFRVVPAGLPRTFSSRSGMQMPTRLTLALVCSILLACGDDPSGGSADAGTSPDAGSTLDAGDTTDAGDATDAGDSCDGWRSGTDCRPFTPCEVVEIEGTPTSDRVCAVDCGLEWSDWGCCRLDYERTQVRTATIVREPTSMGAQCPASLSESRACVEGAPSCACDTATVSTACTAEPVCEWLSDIAQCRLRPIDCEYSAWTEWSACSYPCDAGTQTRTRTIVREAANGGKPCNDPLSATQACNTATHCQCATFTGETACNGYSGCEWSSGLCVDEGVRSCDQLTTDSQCNSSALCCEWTFETCIPRTCE